ncbi:hypothetical protein OD91_0342 [Lutibacter sp. Hel_I_33_5]|uniref:hypothetical protein n=1 Tax=Lutibacter sp. Hel_I_33_5 TaxID=1566289 RepID=UPI0011A29A5C|nr:hypothetical protein [Lutibacter sp. Hel_I_33_5]TVZ55100.1 hypothetical protein OD91_0342 [Lutibacter sp. Hel_I_33_5]
MQVSGAIHQFPKEIKLLISVFIITLSIGFYSSISFVDHNTESNPRGIEERYLGNEADENAAIMKFKRNKSEMMTLFHNHVLSLSVIFFILALILSTTSINMGLKKFLMIEPFASIILTFGGIYIMWLGHTWLKYVIMFSGILMTLTYTASVLIILKQLFSKK